MNFNITDSLPSLIPTGKIRVAEEEHKFTVIEYGDGSSTSKTTYVPNKAPVYRIESVTAPIDGIWTSLEKGSDWVENENDDGMIESLSFTNDGRKPDDNSTFKVDYLSESIVSRYAESYQRDLDKVDSIADDVINSHYVNQAEGAELDEIGKYFGELGERRGRSDKPYRRYLRSVVNSFDGRGTIPGIKFAVAAGIGAEPEDITVIEDFDKNQYTLEIDADTTFISGVVNELAMLADPSGIELHPDPVILTEDGVLNISTSTTVTASQSVSLDSGDWGFGKSSSLQ